MDITCPKKTSFDFWQIYQPPRKSQSLSENVMLANNMKTDERIGLRSGGLKPKAGGRRIG
jgi:hypothetical protein